MIDVTMLLDKLNRIYDQMTTDNITRGKSQIVYIYEIVRLCDKVVQQ